MNRPERGNPLRDDDEMALHHWLIGITVSLRFINRSQVVNAAFTQQQ